MSDLMQTNPIQRPVFSQENIEECLKIVHTALEDLKAKNITLLNVTHLTEEMDYIVITEGTSNRHIRAVANNVAFEAKQAGFLPIGVEGQDASDWVLVDLGAVVVHVMMPQAREFYNLEGLWGEPKA